MKDSYRKSIEELLRIQIRSRFLTLDPNSEFFYIQLDFNFSLHFISF